MLLHDLYKRLYRRSPLDSLHLARRLNGECGHHIRSRDELMGLVGELSRVTAELGVLMTEMAMGQTCSHCASKEGGGCCSITMAGETDTLQILMNFLAGHEIYVMRENGTDCYFLGPQGCAFLFKPIFCLNYNCGHIREAAGAEKMRELERKSGIQLTAQHRLEQGLLDFLMEQDNVPWENSPVKG